MIHKNYGQKSVGSKDGVEKTDEWMDRRTDGRYTNRSAFFANAVSRPKYCSQDVLLQAFTSLRKPTQIAAHT